MATGSTILVAGEALVDLVIGVDGAVDAALGGAPFNTARVCGRLGAPVSFVGSLSDDRFGTLLAGSLVDAGVDIADAPRTSMPTTLAAAELDPGGAASYRFYVDGTSAPALTSMPAGADAAVVFTGGLGLVLQPMADTIEAYLTGRVGAAGLTMVDVNCRPLVVPDRAEYVARVARVLATTDVVKVSDDDLAYLVPDLRPVDAARSLLERGPAAVLLTAGAAGVHVVTAAGDEVTVPVAPVDVVDTIGAGDSFGGGFLTWWLESGAAADEAGSLDRLVPAVEAATTIAGIVCTRRGADPPWRHELPAGWAP